MIRCTCSEVNLPVLLRNGQSFRWHRNSDSHFTGVMRHRVWELWRESKTEINFKVLGRFSNAGDQSEDENILRKYFRLDCVNLLELYDQWKSDKHFAQLVDKKPETLQGICILDQEPFECLLSFICSSNNNIQRISGMIERMCEKFGDSFTLEDGRVFHDFPAIEKLKKCENDLRKLGFGYRAGYIEKTVNKLIELGGDSYLETVRNMEYTKAKQTLLQFTGVGDKVADCVLLMSLGHSSVVPVDTHVWQITAKCYMPELKKEKNLKKQIYKQIGDFYIERFGEYAGWAQSVLFSADLKLFDQGKNNETQDAVVAKKKRRKK